MLHYSMLLGGLQHLHGNRLLALLRGLHVLVLLSGLPIGVCRGITYCRAIYIYIYIYNVKPTAASSSVRGTEHHARHDARGGEWVVLRAAGATMIMVKDPDPVWQRARCHPVRVIRRDVRSTSCARMHASRQHASQRRIHIYMYSYI